MHGADSTPPDGPYCPESSVSIFDRSIVITTPNLASGVIRRPAVTLLLSLDGSPFSLTVDSVRLERVLAVAVADSKARTLRAVGCELASINVEAGHPLFLAARRLLDARGFCVLRSDALLACRDALRASMLGTHPSEPDESTLLSLFDLRVPGHVPSGAAKSRSRREDLLATFEAFGTQPFSLSQMAARFHMSDSRLSHLFVEDVGVPLRSYALWRRHRYALAKLPTAPSLTDLALESGFADAAHMTRTFVNYFGFSPNAVRRSSRIRFFSKAASH